MLGRVVWVLIAVAALGALIGYVAQVWRAIRWLRGWPARRRFRRSIRWDLMLLEDNHRTGVITALKRAIGLEETQ